MPKLNVQDCKLGIDGYDPVSYVDSEPLEGSSDITAESEGVIYRFASSANKERFEADPQKFAPQYGGWCAVAVSEGKYFPVNPKTYTIQDDKLFLFYNAEQGNTLPQWQESPESRQQAADKHWAADDIVFPED